MTVTKSGIVLAVLLASMLAACGDRAADAPADRESTTSTPPADDDAASAATSAGESGPTAAVAPDAGAPSDRAAAPRYRFGFTSISEEDDPRIVDWAEDPCGVTAYADVDAMPIEDPTLIPDYVVEFDVDGKELRRWAKPYSAEIVAIAGERLHFRADHDGASRVFWTQPDGSVGVLEERLANPAAPPAPGFADGATEVECPALPAFEGSDYVQCFEIGDPGARRRVAFEGACS